ncbi:hypothetical protein [Streptomyces sp. NPDC020298]|uniref:hypothetical protein n=1 Tax=unclassified Streptomyces TaxID=2593676 RepID=UPI0033D24AE2
MTVRPGGQVVDFPVEVKGNTRFGDDVRYGVVVKAVQGAVVGSDSGGITVENDDPTPTISVTPVADRVTEGRPLTWRVTLSEAADVDLGASFVVRPVTGGAELSTKDVDSQWLSERSGEFPDPARPLSRLDRLVLGVNIPAGQTSGEITLPTVTDQVTEPTGSVPCSRAGSRSAWPRPEFHVRHDVRFPL